MNAKKYRAHKKKSPASPPAVVKKNEKPDADSCGLLFIAEIHHRAVTMTPLLKEILDHHSRPLWNS